MVAVEKERKRQGNEIGSQWNVVAAAAAAVLSLHQVRMNLMQRELKQKQKQRQQQQKIKVMCNVQYKQCLPGSNGFREITLHERTNEMNILHHWQATHNV